MNESGTKTGWSPANIDLLRQHSIIQDPQRANFHTSVESIEVPNQCRQSSEFRDDSVSSLWTSMITAIAIVKQNGIHLCKTFDHSLAHCSVPIIVEYLAEGAANVVLRLTPLSAASPLKSAPAELKDKLLRVRKDKASLATVAVQHEHLSQVIAPLFPPENLVQHILVTIDLALLEDINRDLVELGTSEYRPGIRTSEFVAIDELHALLVTDMSAIGTQVALEFKPKWLAQSPNAPSKARRCRTCALRAYRRATKDKRGIDRHAFCPLALLDENGATRLRAARAILHSQGQDMVNDEAEPFASTLPDRISPILTRLRDLQQQLDPCGVLTDQTTTEPPPDLCLAMTLRDCTVFVRVQETFRSGAVEIRLADLDVKVAHPDRVKKWRDTETALIQGRWYENMEDNAAPEEVCVLSTQGTDE